MASNVESNDDVLKSIGIDGENAMWMLATAPEFFKWFQENVTEDNILSPTELKEYEELRKAGKLYSDEDLDQKLQEIEKEHPGLSKSNENDLRISSSKLKKLRKISDKQQKVTDELLLIEKSQETKMEKTKLRFDDLEKETKLLLGHAINDTKEFQNVEDENKQLYQDLQNSVNTPKIFTHDMPFYEHFNFIEEFIKQLERFCELNQIQTPSGSVTEKNFESKLVKLDVAKDNYINAYYQEILLEMQVAAMEAVANEIKLGSIKLPSDFSQLMSMLAEFTSVNDQIESQVSTQKQRIHERINEMVLSQIELLSTKNIKYKHDRTKNSIESLTELKPFVTKAIHMSEILWFALKFDWKRLNKDFDLEGDFVACHHTNVRVEIMSRLLKETSIPKQIQSSQDQVMKVIAEVVGMAGNSNVKEVFQAYCHFERDFNEAITSLGMDVKSENMRKSLKELNDTEKGLEEFIYGGATATAQLGDPRFTRKVLKIARKNKIFQEKYTKLKGDYKNLEDSFAQDKFYGFSNVLWIWFLTTPKKVLQAIREVQKASEKTPAHLSGLRRQN